MTFSSQYPVLVGLPSGSIVENPPADAGDVGDTSSTPGWRRYPGGGNGSPLWYSCLGNAMDRGAWWATVHGVSRAGHNLATKQQHRLVLYKGKYRKIGR